MPSGLRTLRGKVVFEDPVHHISGKISKKYRTCYNHKRINGLNFTSVHGERSTPASTNELAQRAKFKVVRLAARSRAMDLMHLTDDQIAFAAQRNEPNGKKTMLAWYWKVCGDEYDETHNG